jgi:hypothetical protein
MEALDLDLTDEDDLAEPELPIPLTLDTRSLPLRYSVLKAMGQSPLHAQHAMLRGGGEQTLARRLGSGAHAMLLGGGEVRISNGLNSDGVTACIKAIRAGEDVRRYPGAVRRGKEWDKFLATNDNATIALQKDYDQALSIIEQEDAGVVLVSKEQFDRAHAIAKAIKANEIASRVLFAPKAVRESRIDWTWNGRAWRSTPDARSFRVLAELKTTRCAEPTAFHRDAHRMNYHVQLAIYRHAIEQTEGVRPQTVYLFAVETVPPFAVVPYRLTERSLEHGWRKAKEWHARWLECEATGKWPGYVDGLAELDVYDPEDEAAMVVERAMADDDGHRAAVSF